MNRSQIVHEEERCGVSHSECTSEQGLAFLYVVLYAGGESISPRMCRAQALRDKIICLFTSRGELNKQETSPGDCQVVLALTRSTSAISLKFLDLKGSLCWDCDSC